MAKDSRTTFHDKDQRLTGASACGIEQERSSAELVDDGGKTDGLPCLGDNQARRAAALINRATIQ